MSSVYTGLLLEKRQNIRLLTVWSARCHSDPLRGELRVVSLEDRCDFEALSYTWNPPFEEEVLEDDVIELAGEALAITGNLSHALRRLRSTTEPKLLWIDAICINQGDVSERGHQVAMMADIFGTATRVLAWLGEDTEEKDGEFVLRHRCNLEDFCLENAIDYEEVRDDREGQFSTPRLANKLSQTFGRRRYFARRWVVQEQHVAREVQFLCGRVQTDWNSFHTALYTGPYSLTIARIYWSLDIARRSSVRGVVPIFDAFQQTQCSDPRDLVIALLCFCRHLNVEVDYSMPVTSTYVALAKAIVKYDPRNKTQGVAHYNRALYEEDLIKLLFVAAGQASMRSLVDASPALPSWVPDWREGVRSFWVDTGTHEDKALLSADVLDDNGLRITLAYLGELRRNVDNADSSGTDVCQLLLDRTVVEISEFSGAYSRLFGDQRLIDHGCILCSPWFDKKSLDDARGEIKYGLVLRPTVGMTGTFTLVGDASARLDLQFVDLDLLQIERGEFTIL